MVSYDLILIYDLPAWDKIKKKVHPTMGGRNLKPTIEIYLQYNKCM